MTTRDLKITRAVLDYLHSLEAGQAEEIIIHREIHGLVEPPPGAAEVHAVVDECDRQKWIRGVPARLTGRMKWNLTDLGEAARLELHE